MNGDETYPPVQYQVPEQPQKKQRNWVRIVVISGAAVVLAVIIAVVLILKLFGNASSTNSVSGDHITSTDDPYAGAVDAQVVVVEFADFQCPFCFQAFPVVSEIKSHYGDRIKFIYRDFPISDVHPDAEPAAEAGECAHEQGKFWEMHDKLFINQSDLSTTALKRYAMEIGLNQNRFDRCLDSNSYAAEIQEDFNDGLLSGVDGTPTFFINGREFQGTVVFQDFERIIDGLLAIYEGEQQ